MRALSVRQPYAELILRGEKTIEYRSRPTRIIGEPFYIYAARPKLKVESQKAKGLPSGVIVGMAVISKCQHNNGNESRAGRPCHQYEWHLSNVKRLPKPRKPKRMPQPVWFKPF